MEHELDDDMGHRKPPKKMHEKSLDDFMNDSLFQEPGARVSKNKSKPHINRNIEEVVVNDRNYKQKGHSK